MPDTQLIAVILLLVVAVIAGYFYLKRAQRRDQSVDAVSRPVAKNADTSGPDVPPIE